MLFPDRRILDFFSDEYMKIRKSTWDSFSHKAQDAMTQAVSTTKAVLSAVFNSPTDTMKQGIRAYSEYENDEKSRKRKCDAFKQRFLTASETKADKADGAWVNIMYDLGKEGREAQTKTSSPEDALFAETTNALRDYIYESIKNNASFQKICNDLLAERSRLQAAIYQAQDDGKSVEEVDKLKKDYKTVILHLADLNNAHAIYEAVNLGLFEDFHYPNKDNLENSGYLSSANIYKPWCYQNEFYLIFYKKHIQPRYGVKTFSDFFAGVTPVGNTSASNISGPTGSPSHSGMSPLSSRSSSSGYTPSSDSAAASSVLPPSSSNPLISEERPENSGAQVSGGTPKDTTTKRATASSSTLFSPSPPAQSPQHKHEQLSYVYTYEPEKESHGEPPRPSMSSGKAAASGH